MNIQWEAPPERQRQSKWSAVFKELKRHPEQWAKLYEGKDRNAHSLAGRLRQEYASKGFEITSRTLEPINVQGQGMVKQGGVYARYTG